MKTLLIVESPAKSKTIEKLLGPDYIVLSSFGHIRNLDKTNLGIDVDNNFKPIYKKLTDRSKQIETIKNTIKKVDKVLLASDEDREGEAIAWHCAIVFKLNLNEKNRICFHEITKKALENAVSNPRTIDMNMVHSQQTRQMLDKIIGYSLSPLLWSYIAPKLSAGRVQSVALKIIIDKEKEINLHKEKKYFKTIANFDKKIIATLDSNFKDDENSNNFLVDCKESIFKIKSIDKNTFETKPPPPYITSTIQQDISSRYGISTKKIMSILQKLYESGLITYHRTDSTNLSTEFQSEIKKYIIDNFDKKYLHPRIYKSKIKCAQEAHEAIRPTKLNKEVLDDNFEKIEKDVYQIIWKRTTATQMSACITDTYKINIEISNRKELFIGKVSKIIFDGYKKIYSEIKNDDDDENTTEEISDDFLIDNIKESEILNYKKISCSEKYDKPTPRFNESTIIKKMEKSGIGRPSTYSSVIETILNRKYVEKKDVKGKKIDVSIFILEKNDINVKKENILFGSEKKKFIPTEMGKNVTEFLNNNFNEIIDSNFTSELENKLDNIVNNEMIWTDVIKDFYSNFIIDVNKLNDKNLIKKNKDDKKRFIGTDNDKKIYAYVGRHGPVIQIGDNKDIKFLAVDSNYDINTLTINDYYEINKYPKIIGEYKDKEIYIKKGPYGFYIFYDKKNYKLKDNLDENLNLEDAIKCIENVTENNDIKVGKYTIKNGPYGYYILFNKKFYNIPTSYEIDKLTLEDCNNIISKKNKKNDYIKKYY